MYTIAEYTDAEQIKLRATVDPFGPMVLKEISEKATKLVIRGTSFDDPGPDFVEWELYKDDESMGAWRRAGY